MYEYQTSIVVCKNYSLFISVALFVFLVEGSWGLKRCENTGEDDAKANMQLADDIVDNPIVNKWYGIYPIGDHGGFDQSCQNASSQEVVTGTKLICL